MTESSRNLPAGTTWLLETWLEKLTGVIAMMTEAKPSVSWTTGAAESPGEGALLIEQLFISEAEPMLWVGLPESVHQDLGSRVLLAAGVDVSDVEENRATALEIIEQSLGGLASAFVKRTGQEAVRAPIKQCLALPTEHSAISVTLSFGETALAPLWIVFNPLLVLALEAKPAEPAAAVPITQSVSAQQSPLQLASSSSRTFELLLDVSLPVSVSFGKTELAVKEVLKLTTGSIVELNRSISEPVDIIVNNCIIARGEVVVVDGNYGVRIHTIVSRKERLQTGASVTEVRASA